MRFSNILRLSLIVLVAISFNTISTKTTNAQQIARARLEGRVIDIVSGDPLEGVHVFISRSSIGAVTEPDGSYLFSLPLGAHRIVVSRIGHRSQVHDVMVRAPRSYLLNFDMEEDLIVLGDLTISDERDKNWDKQLERFTTFFLGTSRNSKLVEIQNPEILDFDDQEGMLVATAAEPLLLENRALGYRIEHHLHQFIVDGDETWQDGESFFVELLPANESEAETWDKNRKKAYNGSALHFFSSMMKGRTRNEGFQVYHVEDPGQSGDQSQAERNSAAPFRKPQFAVNPAIYLEDGGSEQDFIFNFTDYLQIVYTREEEDRAYAEWQKVYHSGEVRDMQYSWIRLQADAATLDPQGNVLDPYSIMFFGYMSFERLADLLPKEYLPK